MNTKWPEFVPDLQPEHFLRRAPYAWVKLAGVPEEFITYFWKKIVVSSAMYMVPAVGKREAEDCARAWDKTCKHYSYTELLGGEWEAPGAR